MRACAVLIVICFAVAAQAQDYDAVKRVAETGNAEAQYKLGYMYHSGTGVAQNYTEAVKWYRIAAEPKDLSDQILEFPVPDKTTKSKNQFLD